MGKLIIIFISLAAGISIAALVHGREASGRVGSLAVAEAVGADVERVASALALDASARATLARAQTLGRQATACLLAHGATEELSGGVLDVMDASTRACAAEIAANEEFLSSREFAAALKEARPKFEAAARCFTRVSGIVPGTIVQPADMTGDLRWRFAKAEAQCFRADGLPRSQSCARPPSARDRARSRVDSSAWRSWQQCRLA